MASEQRSHTTDTRKRKKPHKPSETLAHKTKQKQKHDKPPPPPPPEKQKKQKHPPTAGGGDEAPPAAAGGVVLSSTLPAARQLEFLLRSLERAAKIRLSYLELDSYSDRCMVELGESVKQDVENFGDHVKEAYGASWQEELCNGELVEGVVDAGSPALLVISTSALRSLELLRGLKMFTKECRPVKLFAKHLKVEEQVAFLKVRTNIACGTPSRIKKLIDMEALSLSRLKLVILDMQRDAKSYTLFTLPQVSNEFWDLYNSYLDQKVRGGDTRMCFYGAVSEKDINKVLPSAE